MSEMLRIPLDLPDVRTLGMSTTPRGEFIIKVESTLKGTTCRQCGRHIEASYGRDRPLRLRHLPILDRPVYIEIRPQRYRCPYCEDRRSPSGWRGTSPTAPTPRPMRRRCCGN